jgi:hypothetical protein
VGRKGRRKGSSQGRAEGRVRGRVRERVQGRPGREGGAGRKRGTFDVDAIEGYADRLGDHIGGTSGLAGAASGLAGAASGLAGSSFARRIAGSDTEGSEEDFRKEVTEHLTLIDERLQRLEDEMYKLRGSEGDTGDVTEPGIGTDSQSDRA